MSARDPRGDVNDTPSAPESARVAGAAQQHRAPSVTSTRLLTHWIMSGGGTKLKPVDKIWLDGQLVPFAQAQVHVLTHTLHYGVGAFEGIRAYKRADGRGAIFRLDEHIDRLFDSCHICTMDVPVHARADGRRRASRPCAPTRWPRPTCGRSSSSATARSASARSATRCASSSRSTSGAPTSATRGCGAASAPRSRRSRAARSTRPCRRARSAGST